LLSKSVVFWLDAGAAASMNELLPQLEALTQLASELDARLAGAGLGGFDGALALHARLRAVLDGVTGDDLDRMRRHVAHLQEELGAAARGLAALLELKKRLPADES
jgi:hypothetical protein